MRVTLAAVVSFLGATLAAPGPVRGDPSLPHASEAVETRGMFGRNALGVDFGLGLLGEAWNLNGPREWLADGTLGVWWAFANRAAVVFEFHATRVLQRPSRNAFVTGLAPLLRLEVLEKPTWSLIVDVGAGVSWSDTTVPPRGTRFNYLVLADSAVTRRIGRQSHAVVGFRWLHVSNNGLEGRSRNPDIEALGGYAGLSMAF